MGEAPGADGVAQRACDVLLADELIDLVEMEARELLSCYKFPSDEIPIVQATRTMTLEVAEGEHPETAFLSCDGELGYRAIRGRCRIEGDRVAVSAEHAETIGAEAGMAIGVTPVKPHGSRRRHAKAASA